MRHEIATSRLRAPCDDMLGGHCEERGGEAIPWRTIAGQAGYAKWPAVFPNQVRNSAKGAE